MTTASTPPGTVARAVRMMAAIADAGEPVSISTLVGTLGLPASSVHRMLALLADEGIVERDGDTRTYRVGPELYRVAARTVATVGLAEIVQPSLQELADDFGETVLLGLLSPATASLAFIARADGDHLLQYRIDLHAPVSIVWGASGKAVAAYLPPADVATALERERGRLGGARSPGGAELPTASELARQLERVRALGYALSEGEKLTEARGLSVPVIGTRGVQGSLTLTHPRDRPPVGDTASIVERLQAGAAAIALTMGGAR